MRTRNFLLGMAGVMMLAGGCTEQKPKEEKPSDAVVEQKKEEPALVDSSALMKEREAKEAEDSKKTVAKPSVEKNATIVGEVIDVVSYATSGVQGNSPTGKEIIETGARGGNPLGVLEKGTGEVYIVTMKQANTPANTALLPFVGMNIAVKGDIYRKGGQQLLVMTTVGKSIK
ncbi:MAG: hypothetical protein ACKVRP_15540 [Bacteroidota bacterium]